MPPRPPARAPSSPRGASEVEEFGLSILVANSLLCRDFKAEYIRSDGIRDMGGGGTFAAAFFFFKAAAAAASLAVFGFLAAPPFASCLLPGRFAPALALPAAPALGLPAAPALALLATSALTLVFFCVCGERQQCKELGSEARQYRQPVV